MCRAARKQRTLRLMGERLQDAHEKRLAYQVGGALGRACDTRQKKPVQSQCMA